MSKSSRSSSIKNTASALLDAAEKLFAQKSYEGTSIRDITNAADVRLGLMHYHFASKEALFKAVLSRRSDVVNASRIAVLEHYCVLRGPEPLLAEDIVRSYISPYVYWCKVGGSGWRDYAKLGARILSSDSWKEILSELYDEPAKRFLAELRRSFPNCGEARIQWAFDFMVGSMASTFSVNNRVQRLSDGLCSASDLEEPCAQLVPFITSGVEAVLKGTTVSFASDFEIVSQQHHKAG